MSNEFRIRAIDALADKDLQSNFRGAMDFLQAKRRAAFKNTDLEALQHEGAAIRHNVLNKLPALLEQLESHCINNGIQVHWAEGADEAREVIASIAQDNQVKNVVKGKSMATEEIELNSYLESLGISCIETDMGEYIVQLDEETPSHIIMPAIHKSKADIARLFAQKLGENTEDASVDQLIGIGRKVLRNKFLNADMGISGVNFAIAQTGSLCLVENEGNGRMSTTVPKIHVALMGIEKVIPSFDELPTLLQLLTGSATGQLITTYLNIISSPKTEGELDGPEQVHLVLLDNGRSNMYADEQLKETLACIRCGACMNHCPVYTRIGGHAYGSTYPGPIGQVVTPQIEGIEKKGDLLDACSLNGACGEVCPVNIQLPTLIRELRSKQLERKPVQAWIWRIWAWMYSNQTTQQGLRYAMKLARPLLRFAPKAWRASRTTPQPAAKTFSEQMREHAQENMRDTHAKKHIRHTQERNE